MSDNDQQEALLMAIEFLKIQYKTLQHPCIALHISRYYRLLSLLNIAPNWQQSYIKLSKTWLDFHINSPEHSQKTQDLLNDYFHCHELN